MDGGRKNWCYVIPQQGSCKCLSTYLVQPMRPRDSIDFRGEDCCPSNRSLESGCHWGKWVTVRPDLHMSDLSAPARQGTKGKARDK